MRGGECSGSRSELARPWNARLRGIGASPGSWYPADIEHAGLACRYVARTEQSARRAGSSLQVLAMAALRQVPVIRYRSEDAP